jgi:hypothetical protein
VPHLLLVEVGMAGNRLAGERGEEQDEEDDGQAVLPQEAAHQLCIRPMAA